jgi:hypothetical protein
MENYISGHIIVKKDTETSVKEKYIVDSDGEVIFNLPKIAELGDNIGIIGSRGSWKIKQRKGQKIQFSEGATREGECGYVKSMCPLDSIHLVCIEKNKTWYGSPTGELEIK